MRVITWNCKQGFRKKYSDIEFFNPDILVIPECESLDKIDFSYSKTLLQILTGLEKTKIKD